MQFCGRDIQRIVILTGTGISAESGLATFRDSGGLWEGHDPMEIATPEAFDRNPELVYRFYNARRRHSSIGYLSPLQYEHHLARQADQTAQQAA